MKVKVTVQQVYEVTIPRDLFDDCDAKYTAKDRKEMLEEYAADAVSGGHPCAREISTKVTVRRGGKKART